MSTPQTELRVLRLGLLRDGQVVVERLVPPGATVTIGRGAHNTLVVPDPSFPRRVVLLSPQGGSFALQVDERMSGRVALAGGVYDLSGAAGGQRAVRLDPKSRGRVQFGAWTVLFQWVTAPPVPLRAPPSFRAPLIAEDDPVFVGSLAAFSALALAFFAVAARVPLPPDGVDVTEIPERVVDLAQAFAALPPEPVAGEVQDAPSPRQQRQAARRADRQAARDAADSAPAPRARQSVEEQAAAVSAFAARLLGTRGEPGRGDLFAQDDAGAAALAASLDGVTSADVASLGGLSLRQGSGGRDFAGGAELGRGGAGKADLGSGPAVAVNTRLGTVEPVGAKPGQADALRATLSRYTAGVQACYEQELRRSPELTGRLVLSVSVTDGVVREVIAVENSTGSEDLSRCAELRAKAWRFDRDVTVDLLAPFSLSRG